MIHLLAEMYDYGIHELSRRQGRYMQAEIFDKVNKYNSFVSLSLREGLQHSCIEWIKPQLLTSMTIEVSSVLQ